MRVAFLTTSYPRFEGDFRGIFIARLASSLRQAGADVVVVEPKGYARLKRGAGLVPNLRTSWLARAEFPLYCAHFLVIAVYHAFRCDLIHANWSLSGFVGVLAGRVARKPVIVTERGQFLIDSRNRWLNRWLHWVLSRADDRVVISTSARETLRAKFPDLSFDVIPNGVDDEAFSPSRRGEARQRLGMDGSECQILTVGRLTPVKRLDTLVSALETLERRGAEFRAWIVGDGEERSALEQSLARANLRERVTLLGARPHDETALWTCAADVFVLCSEGEGGGNVVLEAMSAGLVVVSTPVGWAKDFIADGENGIHVPVGDSGALAAALDPLVASVERRRELGAAARGTIESEGLNWSGCATRYLGHYRELVK